MFYIMFINNIYYVSDPIFLCLKFILWLKYDILPPSPKVVVQSCQFLGNTFDRQLCDLGYCHFVWFSRFDHIHLFIWIIRLSNNNVTYIMFEIWKATVKQGIAWKNKGFFIKDLITLKNISQKIFFFLLNIYKKN